MEAVLPDSEVKTLLITYKLILSKARAGSGRRRNNN
jgi:hypothetical protein